MLATDFAAYGSPLTIPASAASSRKFRIRSFTWAGNVRTPAASSLMQLSRANTLIGSTSGTRYFGPGCLLSISPHLRRSPPITNNGTDSGGDGVRQRLHVVRHIPHDTRHEHR